MKPLDEGAFTKTKEVGGRWPAFSLSLILHVGAIALLTWIDVAFAPPVSPHYEVSEAPDRTRDSKIIWYDFHKIPELTPNQPFGPSTSPHGEIDPGKTVITLSPDAPSTHQIIRQPDHPQLLPVDVPAPNLVAVAVKPLPKVFVPPPPPKQAQVAAIKPIDAPTVDTTKTPASNALGAIASLQKLPPKTFVPPPAPAAGTKAAPQIAVPVPASPDTQANSIQALQEVIVGLNPGTTLPPPGSRAAQIARAPDAGTPASGTPVTSATVVPGLLSHSSAGDLPGQVSGSASSNPGQRPPQEIVLPGVNRTMSAPLRPSSRVIPASVEAKFTYRNVYTLVIPGPALPGYGGDWVMWFAEQDPPEISSGPRILAPIPSRKYSPTAGDTNATELIPATTFQFGASINKAGHVGSPVILKGPADPALRRRAMEEIASWEFKPASRNGEAMDVDVVLEISFRWQPAAAALQ
jgi:hypothetical protein